jgi:phospholipid/cholesterol/gamma-HCH transport system permease protein
MAEPTALRCSRSADGGLEIQLVGSWTLEDALPAPDAVEREVASTPPVRRVSFDSAGLAAWDTGLLTFLRGLLLDLQGRDIAVDEAGLPEGARRLLDLAAAVPPRLETKAHGAEPLLAHIGNIVVGWRAGAGEMFAFLGEVTLAFGRLLVGRARFRRSDLTLTLEQCGADALPIVSLVSFLVGLILAFIGAIQLRLFGAEIFVADLVGLGMAREMGAMMTAIIMAGRTGAAFAAQLGTMTVNEEIDALRALGIPPMDFLVLPRMLALMLMMPLLALYAVLLGMLGGALVGVGMLDITVTQYVQQTQAAIGLDSFFWGVLKAAVYGALVAIAGCLRGMQCGRSAAAVGQAATSAVVTAIVMIVVASGVLNLIDNVLQEAAR